MSVSNDNIINIPQSVYESPLGVFILMAFGFILLMLTLSERIGGKIPKVLASFRRVSQEKNESLTTSLKADVDELLNLRKRDRDDRKSLTAQIAGFQSQLANLQVQVNTLRTDLDTERRARKMLERRNEEWHIWHRDVLVASWHVIREHDSPPSGPGGIGIVFPYSPERDNKEEPEHD